MDALGRILLVSEVHDSFRQSIWSVARIIIQSAAAGFVFTALGGNTLSPAGLQSLLPALAAAVTYTVGDRALRSFPTSITAIAVALGVGYIFAGTASALPASALLIPGLPLSIVLLRTMHKPATVETVSEPEPEEEDETPKPSMLDPVTGLANQRYMEMF
jgi:hypothetical protein